MAKGCGAVSAARKKPAAGKTVRAKAQPKGDEHQVSPLAPKSIPHLPPLAGFRMASGEAGVRYRNRTDVLLVVMATGTQVAGVFTKSKTASAPVEWCKAQLKRGTARALV